MLFLEQVWHHWFFVALLAPLFMALVNIVDIHFVRNVYVDEWDGILISSFFQITPWILVVFGIISFHLPGISITLLSLAAGWLLSIAGYFYFRSLYSHDMILVQSVASTSILLVPFLSWVIIGERLTFFHYIGILLAFLGVSGVMFSKKQRVSLSREKIYPLFLFVMLLSLSMVLQGHVYKLISNDFWTGFLLFVSGGGLAMISLLLRDPMSLRKRLTHIYSINQKYFLVFTLMELFNLFGIISTQRALDLSPSVSLVITIESLLPIFILLISGFLIILFLFLDRKEAYQIYRDQFVNLPIKIFAMSVVIFGVYLAS